MRIDMPETPVFLRDGTPITVRAIKRSELDRIVLRCWPDRKTLDRLFAEQGTIGVAAWEGDRCVAQLHCYRVTAPDGNEWKTGANWWTESDRVFEGWGQWGPRKSELGLSGPIWCHACFHVGRTLETFCAEMLEGEVLPNARKHQWNDDRIVRDLAQPRTSFTPELVRRVLQAKRSESGFTSWKEESRYFGQGIGTAMCKESIRRAKEHGYAALVAPGAADGLVEFARWYGHMPWTTYARLGFRDYPVPPEETSQLPDWAKGRVHEPIASEIRNALRSRPVNEILERLMVLELQKSQHGAARDGESAGTFCPFVN